MFIVNDNFRSKIELFLRNLSFLRSNFYFTPKHFAILVMMFVIHSKISPINHLINFRNPIKEPLFLR